jgi:hypothetical protein
MQAQSTIAECPTPMTAAALSTPAMARWVASRKSVSHATFLADASKRLAGSLDLHLTVRCLAELSVPTLGEACLVYLPVDGQPVGERYCQ